MIFSFLFTTNKVYHTTACLIQGLHELGHEIRANYVPTSAASNGIHPPFSDAAPNYITATSDLSKGVLVVDNGHGWTAEDAEAINQHSNSRDIVIINMNDSSNYLPHNEKLNVFQAHYNNLVQRKGKNFPMAFGISNEIIKEANKQKPQPRVNQFLYNFRPSINQSVRESLNLSLIPNLRKYFEITAQFSTPREYVNQLLTHQAVFCYGGDFYSDVRLNAAFTQGGLDEMYNFKDLLSATDAVVLRFDSWRMYEVALFGAAPITLHFEKYGLETGANPRPWVEYIPVEFDKVESLPQEIAQRLKDDPEFLIKVGQNARRWVLENHAPIPTAQRFINKLAEIKIL